MCGFFQVAQKSKPVDREAFRKALSSMSHRGPDLSGELFLDHQILKGSVRESVHLGFGHRRLSILDLSDKSRQPISINGNVLIYNGELYNYQELNCKLLQNGENLETTGDTETLFKCVLSKNERALESFNGMWAFSMYRKAEGRIFLSRDRYGKKPLFYYQDSDTFCASSTILAIQIYLKRKLDFRRNVLTEYLIYGTLYPSGTADTHFEEISQIIPGSWANFDLTTWSLRQDPYFDFHNESLIDVVDKNEELLVETLKDSVLKRLISDRPVGLLLSGGIDSTLILSTLFALGLKDRCKVFMGDTGRSEDYKYAKRCVNQLGIEAQTVVLDYDHNTFERFLEVCRHQEKPVSLNGSSMGMPQMYEVISSQGVPVVLDGTGGDEIFGGYWQRQLPYAVREAVRNRDWHWLRQQLLGEAGENDVKTHMLRSLLPSPWDAARRTYAKKFKALIYPNFKADIRVILQSSPTDPLENPSLTFSQAMCADLAPGGRLGEWLWHNDRNSMMSGIEARSPLLDHRLNRFVYSGYQNKFSKCWNKHELRRTFDLLAPLPSQWRKQKQGFRWDGKHFLRNNKSKILELIRANSCLEDIVDISKMVSLANKQPNLLRSSFYKHVLAISGVERAFAAR